MQAERDVEDDLVKKVFAVTFEDDSFANPTHLSSPQTAIPSPSTPTKSNAPIEQRLNTSPGDKTAPKLAALDFDQLVRLDQELRATISSINDHVRIGLGGSYRSQVSIHSVVALRTAQDWMTKVRDDLSSGAKETENIDLQATMASLTKSFQVAIEHVQECINTLSDPTGLKPPVSDLVTVDTRERYQF